MCGIFGIVGQDASSKTFNGLLDIEYRGYDSWGIASWNIEAGKWKIDKKIGFLPSTLKLPSSSIAIGHTRWATHGGVTELNAHPHTDCTGQLVMVHNGIVENYLDLKKTLKNHKIKSQTDTEVIIHLIEEEYKKSKNLTKAVSAVFRKLDGLNALVVTDGKEIVACKIGSPLVAGVNGKELLVASDPNALLPHTKKLLFLEDGQMVVLNDKLNLYKLSLGVNVRHTGSVSDSHLRNFQEITPKFTEVDWSHTTSSLNKFPHFMMKEIFEQPAVLRAISQNVNDVKTVSAMVKKAFGTFFIACGSASYTALEGVYLFSKIAKKHVNFSVGSEFVYLQDYLTPKSLLVAVSQSGESIDTLEPTVAAKKKGVNIVSLVNVLGSSLYRISDYPLLLQAGMEKAVCSTKAVTAMLAYMIMLAYSVAGKQKEGQEIVMKSSEEAGVVLKKEKAVAKLAEKIKNSGHIYVLGRGLSYPVALETTLKIKEVSYIHAEGFAGGELKHGVIAMIEKGTPVIAFVPSDETKDAMLANIMEVKARGAYVIGIGPEKSPAFDFFFEVKDVGASSIIPHVVFAQLLGYYLAVKRGKNPDKPRNLAKSVVVR
ncbi:MAG: glucosamine--fructose-6-phosphate aminotransferase (isomerizing) [Microgenomates group bacterium Gr01-1014_80]|nr:MAG: glucosamine--fructose-6-phosphate aminotransferase (isomerizing) [Microgenomates group bacterium Gr01-1014_80]